MPQIINKEYKKRYLVWTHDRLQPNFMMVLEYLNFRIDSNGTLWRFYRPLVSLDKDLYYCQADGVSEEPEEKSSLVGDTSFWQEVDDVGIFSNL